MLNSCPVNVTVGVKAFAVAGALFASTSLLKAGTVLPEMIPIDAVKIDVPDVTPVARPAPFTVATEGVSDVQVTSAVIFAVVPSE